MDYALETLHQQLTRHFHRYGLEGGIYQFDFKGYFGSLPHDLIKARARRVIRDDRLYRLYCSYIDDFLKMKTADPKAKRKRGVGLGSEVSQITALDAASPIDHYFKDRRRVEAYGRYMDDGYAISPSLEELRDLDRCNHLLAADLGLTLNDKKCTITPLQAPQLHLPEGALHTAGERQGHHEAEPPEHQGHPAEDGHLQGLGDRGADGRRRRHPELPELEGTREAVRQLPHPGSHGRPLHVHVCAGASAQEEQIPLHPPGQEDKDRVGVHQNHAAGHPGRIRKEPPMEYIVHHRCRELSAAGDRLNLPYGTRLNTIGDFIATAEGGAICFTTSELAHRYMARNDDGRGLERGKVSWAIAYSRRERRSDDGRHRQRFTDREIEMLEREWSRYLVPDAETILFNHAFFEAEPEELLPLARALNIKP